MGGYMSMDGTHMSLPKVGKNIILLPEGHISPYIENIPQPRVNFIEEDIGVYSSFLEEDNYVTLPLIGQDDLIWYMHFDVAYSSEGKGVNIM
jgi:hypothetical protein